MILQNAKPVFIEILKAKDVKQAYCLLGVFSLFRLRVNHFVDLVHNPNEKSSINRLVVQQRVSPLIAPVLTIWYFWFYCNIVSYNFIFKF